MRRKLGELCRGFYIQDDLDTTMIFNLYGRCVMKHVHGTYYGTADDPLLQVIRFLVPL